MTLPRIIVEMAFNDPDGPPDFTDMSELAQDVDITRGASHQLGRIEPGSASVLFDDTSRRLDPTNDESAFWPNVVPMRLLYIHASHENVDYPMFYGYTTDYLPAFPGGGYSSLVVKAVEGLAPLQVAKVTQGFPEQTTGQRVRAVLNSVQWPASLQDIDEGQEIVPQQMLEGVSALAHLQAIVDAELGVLFISRSGVLTFYDRDRWFSLPFADDSRTWGDEYPELAHDWRKMNVEYPGQDTITAVNVNRLGQPVLNLTNDDAVRRFLVPQTLTISDLLVATDEAVEDRAAFELFRGVPGHALRIASFVPEPEAGPYPSAVDSWPQALGLELGDRIRLRHRPPTEE